MSQSVVATRPQLALQSYLDSLLQEATWEADVAVPPPASSVSQEEFEAAVMEEQVRDARLHQREDVPQVQIPAPALKVIELRRPGTAELPPAPLALLDTGRPQWAAEPFECLLFDVAGLTLAVPLVCLGSIHSLEGRELNKLVGQPDWFLG